MCVFVGRPWKWFLVIFALFFAVEPGARAEGSKVAIVAAEDLATVADLLQAQLSAEGVPLVERTELDRVLHEHQLDRGQAVDEKRAGEVGPLVGADVLLLLHIADERGVAVLELRTVRVSPGFVLDAKLMPWPPPDLDAWSRETARQLRQALTRGVAPHAVAVSTIRFQPATPGMADASVATAASLRMNIALTGTPGVVVLERTAVNDLTRERTLLGANQYLTGAFLLDGSVEGTLTGKGPIKLGLRLQPMGGGKEQTFVTTGSADEIPALVQKLQGEVAAALALPAGAESGTDVEAEAHRYAQDAEAALQMGMCYRAYQSAEMAALLGEHGSDFDTTHAQALATILVRMETKLARSGYNDVIRANWDEKWIRKKVGDDDWLRPGEFLTVEMKAVELWRDVCRHDLLSGGYSDVRDSTHLVPNILPTVLQTNRLLAEAPLGIRDYADECRTVNRSVIGAIEETWRYAEERRQHRLTAHLVRAQADKLPMLYPSADQLNAELQRLLQYPYRHGCGPGARASLAGMMLTQKNSVSFKVGCVVPGVISSEVNLDTPWVERARESWLGFLRAGTTPEMKIAAAAFECREADSHEERAKKSSALYALILANRDFFEQEPTASIMFKDIEQVLAVTYKDAPNFYEATETGGEPIRTEEWAQFRWDLFSHYAEGSEQDRKNVHFVYDKDTASPEQRDIYARLFAPVFGLQLGPKSSDPNATVPAPAPVSVSEALRAAQAKGPEEFKSVVDYRAFPPLRIEAGWTVGTTDEDKSTRPQIPGMGSHGDHFWLYVEKTGPQGEESNGLLEFEIPSLYSHSWPLPEEAWPENQPQTGGAYSIAADEDHVYLARSHLFFAVGDRRTRKWEIHHDVGPASGIVASHGDFYFLEKNGGQSGLMRYSPTRKALDLVASNRRVPAITPLDHPGLEILGMVPETDGRLHLFYIKADAPGHKTLNTYEGVIYDPVKDSWEEADGMDDRDLRAGHYLPVEESTLAVTSRAKEVEQWLLQLPFAPGRAILPFQILLRDAQGKWSERPLLPLTQSTPLSYWFHLAHGYVISDFGKHFWYLPDAKLKDYLDQHTPTRASTDELWEHFQSQAYEFN